MKFLKTQVIVNPESDKGKTRRRWKEIKEAIKSFIHDFKVEFTEKPFQATEIARSAVKSGAELVIGVGGDGTINEIANGFFEERRIINSDSALGILPSGTGCDLTKSLKIPRGFKEALKVITQAPSTLIDIGRVTFRNRDGGESERLFLNVADFGLGGEVVSEVNQRRLERKASSYVRCLISTMTRYKNKRIRVQVDGRELPEGEYLVGAVANGKIFGKGMKIAPAARLDDGLFDFVLVEGMTFREFCRHGWKIFFGTHLSHPKISLWRAKKVEAMASDEQDVLLELDGEQLGLLPATFEIFPRRLLVKGYV
ncbi:MAG: diacylglycerol kinase family lipid kinase [Clostridiales bacterium]|nr:diacylglycerol kinase family lipid kinase [Clostridiales bacterium]